MQPFGQFSAVNAVILVAFPQQGIPRGIADHHFRGMGLQEILFVRREIGIFTFLAGFLARPNMNCPQWGVAVLPAA